MGAINQSWTPEIPRLHGICTVPTYLLNTNAESRGRARFCTTPRAPKHIWRIAIDPVTLSDYMFTH